MEKNGRAKSTVDTVTRYLIQLSRYCDVTNPDEMKETLSKLKWQNNTKHCFSLSYQPFLKFLGKTWEKPKYQQQEGLPFIPTEQELDTLIASGRIKIATFLQILKETGARSGEIEKLEWTHIDTERRTIYITAEKGSDSRILPISPKLLGMINQLPHDNTNVFPTPKESNRKTFEALRTRASKTLNNPRLTKIHLHTFRHWKGTIEYHKTKDIIHVKTVLGHKDIESTMIYINLENAIFLDQNDEWTCKATKETKEATTLIEAGFNYIATTPDGLMLFRKRK
jgi:integrase